MRFGAFLPGAPASPAAIDGFRNKFGVTPSVISWYQAWGDVNNAQCRIELLNTVRSFGAVPMITWEPWNPAKSSQCGLFEEILSGKHDAYIDKWSRVLTSFRRRVLLRFAHEMNGDWYPWGRSSLYVETWKHVRGLMETAVNVEWVWSPNVTYENSPPMSEFWPGTYQVDVLGLDGYNWNSPWVTPEELFGASIKEIRALADKELMITETACDDNDEKPRWIKQLFKLDDVDCVIWFNEHKELNWRLDSSVRSAKAFRSCIEKGNVTWDLYAAT